MANTTFVDYSTPTVNAAWLNDVNDFIYEHLPNAKAAGAVGDNSTDDHAALQAFFDANVGGAVFIPRGTYLVSAPLEIDSSLTIIGAGIDATIIRGTAGSGSVFEFQGNGGSLGPFRLQDLRIGGAGCTGISEQAGSGVYTYYVSRLNLINVATESDLLYGMNCMPIYLDADKWWDGYYTQTSANVNHQALIINSGSDDANVLNFTNCKFNNSQGAYAIQIEGGSYVIRFSNCDWSLNKRNLYCANVSSLRVENFYSELCNPVTGSLFVIDPSTRGEARFIQGHVEGSSMANNTNIFGFAPTAKVVVEGCDLLTSANAYAYLDTSGLGHSPINGNHHFKNNRYSGNTSDPLYFLDNVQENTPVAWTPSPTSLTLGGSPGTAVYTGYWSISNRMVTIGIKIDPDSTSTTASTAASTYFTCPTSIPVPAYSATGTVANEVQGSIGNCFVQSGVNRVYMPAWTAQQNNMVITITYPI